MAGRNYLSPNTLKVGGEVPLVQVAASIPHHRAHPNHQIDDPPLLHRLHNHHHPSSAPSTVVPATLGRTHPSALLEDRIAIQHREIQSLLLDNQRLAATHVALKQELTLAQEGFHHLSATAGNVKAERDAEVREVYERSLKMDAEARSADAMAAELAQVRSDLQELSAIRQELTAQLQKINGELAKARTEAEQVPAIKAEIETMQQEVQRGRAAIEYEKKTRASNLEQDQAMEKNMISMVHEIEKLHAELANAEKRARAAAAAAAAANPSPGYAVSYGNIEFGYGGSPYPDPYVMHQVQVAADAVPTYLPGAMLHVPYDMHGQHVHR